MKTTLVAILGLSPQILTETLFALHQQGTQLDAIRVLTTRDGKAEAIAQLFGNGDGHYFRYLTEYGIAPDQIDFAPRHVQAVGDGRGGEIDDIDTEEENERFLTACMKLTHELTRDPGGRVLFSIAGGRKTMSACLSLAAQCYGRSQDRIYHILVRPAEFETCREFFYPPKTPRPIEASRWDRASRRRIPVSISSAEAELTLVPMPFFSLREQLVEPMLAQPQTPAALLLSLAREGKNTLVIDLREKVVRWKGREMDVPPAWLALYTLFAEHKKRQCCEGESCHDCDRCYLGWTDVVESQQELHTIYSRLRAMFDPGEMSNSGIAALSAENFRSYISRLGRAIENTFGPYERRQLAIEPKGTKPNVRYGIPLDRGQIEIRY